MTERPPRGFWVAAGAGFAVMGYAVAGVLGDARATHPRSFAAWVVGAALVHDLLVAPVVCLVGLLLGRVLREPWRTPVRTGLIVSGVVLLVAWPALRGYGRDRVPDNLSVQPLDYTAAVLTVLAVVWAVVAVWLAARLTHVRRPPPGAPRPPTHG